MTLSHLVRYVQRVLFDGNKTKKKHPRGANNFFWFIASRYMSATITLADTKSQDGHRRIIISTFILFYLLSIHTHVNDLKIDRNQCYCVGRRHKYIYTITQLWTARSIRTEFTANTSSHIHTSTLLLLLWPINLRMHTLHAGHADAST